MNHHDLTRNRLRVKPTDWKPAGTGIVIDNPNRDPITNKMAPDISTNDLLDTHTKRRNQRVKVYERVYRKCCQRIRHANDIMYAKECIFKVPELELWGGTPLYQVNAVIGYIMLRLKQKGFDVRYLPPDSVMIDWKKAVTGDVAFKSDVIRYELDELNTSVPKLDHVATIRERLIHEGCKGECCSNDPNRPPKLVNKKQQLELERRKQQLEIDRVIAKRDRQGPGRF